jgi:signal transduction histidine kinase
MNASSFRFRFALLAGLVSTVLLLVSGAVFWRLTRDFALDRLDREIRNLGQANLERVVGPSHWARLENALGFVAGEERAPGYVIWARGADRVVYRSAAWPAGLAPERFPHLNNVFAVPDTPPLPRRDRPISRENPALPLLVPRFFTVEAEGRAWRIGLMGNPYVTLALGADLAEFDAGLARLGAAFAVTMAGAWLLVVGGAWWLARSALRPVERLTEAVEAITARGLDQRIAAPVDDPDFQRLAAGFNAMLNRLERSFHQATRFSADASHELKTPLSLLQGALEQTIEAAPPGSSTQAACASMLEDVQRLKAIVHKLLILSLADAGRLSLHRAPLALTALLRNVVEDLRARAPEVVVGFRVDVDPWVAADADLLEQAFQNLATNALKYNRPDGRIELVVRVIEAWVLIEVGNTGAGIAAADRAQVFERFYRGATVRADRAAGTGLGLALAREIVRAHEGEILLLESVADWTVFQVSLPLASN